jgi:hypothetical protein
MRSAPSAVVVGVGLLALGAVLVAGCEEKAAPTTGAGLPKSPGTLTTVLKVAIKTDGTVLVDGVACDLQKLDLKLRLLAANKGEVWFYRENMRSEPHPVVNAVMDLIIKNAVGFSVSTRPDFGDYIDAEGVVHPRN